MFRHLALAAAILAAPSVHAAHACVADNRDPAAERNAVVTVLEPIEAEHFRQVEAAPLSASPAEEARLDTLQARRLAARASVLEPLAAQGNAEAMVRLADDIRDEPAQHPRWLALATCAANAGHPLAIDDWVRWAWHQKGDGSIAAIQGYRARALDAAARNAALGRRASLRRIATYIRGDVHQYPAAPQLSARLATLAAADRPWPELAPEWREIRGAVLDYGQTSPGAPTACTTATPWCRPES
ncbi:MAG: hypothetical protein U1C74_34395 [Phenylobacterium sp.]|nr:hypothetical protein [Phenylobacterium sp.]